MTSKDEHSLGRMLRFRQALLVAFAIGMVTGFVRVAGLSIVVFLLGRFVQQGPHLLWMAPLGTMLVTVSWGAITWVAGIRWPVLRTVSGLATSVLSIAFVSLALDINGLHRLSAVVLGTGMAVACGRLIKRAPIAIVPLARTVSIASGVAFAACVLTIGWHQNSWRVLDRPVFERQPPNVLLIVLDTVRAASIGPRRSNPATTPVLNELARSGTAFEEAYSTAPWTTPSHASIMTGKWPTELGVDWDHGLASGHPTLAEEFGRAGYRTAGFSANEHNAGFAAGIARGFDHFEDYTVSIWNVLRGSAIGERYLPRMIAPVLGRLSSPSRKRSPEVSRQFLAWLDEQESGPFFVFLNYYDAHDPYESTPELDAAFGVNIVDRPEGSGLDSNKWSAKEAAELARAYEAAIRYQDGQLGLLLSGLQTRGQLQNTIVVVTSDHGEEFLEHGVMRHGNSLYNSSVHVPLVVAFPGRVPADQVVNTPVSIRSIATTVTRLAGLDHAGDFPGPDLLDIQQGEPGEPVLMVVDAVPAQPESSPVHFGPLFALIDRHHKYIVDARGREEIYALSDKDERFNLSGAAESIELLRHFRGLVAARRPVSLPALGEGSPFLDPRRK